MMDKKDKLFLHKIERRRKKNINPQQALRNEDGAIDLSSIMVGIIVIGLIGGVIAATVFAVIPWAQDNAAKQQLDSVVSAESAYFGLSADNPPALPAGAKANSFGKSAELATANLLQTGPRYCVTTPADSKSYDAYSQSSSGTVFTVTDKNSKPVIFTGTLPTDCQFISDGIPSTPVSNPSATTPAAYVDPTPKTTIMTYRCDANTTVSTPLNGNLTGTETWSDNPTAPKTYNNATYPSSRSLLAGVTYTVTFEGTYKNFSSAGVGSTPSKCLRSLDHWGMDTGVTSASHAFFYAPNVVSVPEHVPSTITNMASMFEFSSSINDPSISNWDVSNVTDMSKMFYGAAAFNQSLNKWKTSKVTNMLYMFTQASSFDSSVEDWDTSQVTSMDHMFWYASSFNQNLNNWNVSNVTNMSDMFGRAYAFNKDLNGWDTSSVTTMNDMFRDATKFNGDVTTWNVSKVTDMIGMFYNDSAFNRDLHLWNTASITGTYASSFAPATFPTIYLPPKATK